MREPTNVPPGRPRFGGLWLPAAAMLALAAACFARLLADPSGLILDGDRPSIDYANRGDQRPVGNDLTFLFLPHHRTIADRIARFGHLPAWDARGFGGRPMAGNPQAGMSYPAAWLAWWSGAPSVLGWLTVAHLIWGGVGTYVLVRSMGTGRWAATVAAGVYQASPYLMAHTFEGHYPHVWAACWYPWAFWAYRRHREGRTSGLLRAPMLALCYLTGHPQEWLMLVLALTIWALGDGLLDGRKYGTRRAALNLAAWLGLLSISVGMAGIDIAPQFLARPWLRRGHEPGFDGVPRRYHLGGLNTFQLLCPTALGGPADYFGDDNYWESVLSIGLVPLVLAIVAATRHPDRRLVRAWLGMTALAVAFAFGRTLGLYSLLHATIPGVGWIRVPARSLFLANIAGAVLAGLGMETLLTRMTSLSAWRRLAWRLGAVGAVVIVSLLLIHRGRSLGPDHPRDAAAVTAPPSPPSSGRTARAVTRILGDPRFWVSICGTAVIIAVGCRPIGLLRRRRAIRLIGLVALAELGWYGFTLIRVAPAARFVGPDPVSAALMRLDAEPPGLRPPVRIKARDSFYGDLPAAVHGIEKTNVDDAFQIDRAAMLYETLYPVASRVRPMSEMLMSPDEKHAWRRIRRGVFDRMGVAFLVSDRVEADPPWPIAAEGVWDGSRFAIQRNTSAMPRAYVVPGAAVLPDNPGVVLSALGEIDPRGSVVMTVDPLAGLSPGPRQPFTPAEWTSIDPDRPALAVTTQAPGLLVVADTWMPGWIATVDGRAVPVLRGNHAQRVIPLPKGGRHGIVMEYHPPGLVLGRAATMASALAWLMTVLRRVRAAARARRAPGRRHRLPPDPAGFRARIRDVRHPICLAPGD